MPPITGNDPEHFALNTDIELPADLIKVVRSGRKALHKKRSEEAERARALAERVEREEEQRKAELEALRERALEAMRSGSMKDVPHQSIRALVNWREEHFKGKGDEFPTEHVVEFRCAGFLPIAVHLRVSPNIRNQQQWGVSSIWVSHRGADCPAKERVVADHIEQALALARDMFLAERPPLAPA